MVGGGGGDGFDGEVGDPERGFGEDLAGEDALDLHHLLFGHRLDAFGEDVFDRRAEGAIGIDGGFGET